MESEILEQLYQRFYCGALLYTLSLCGDPALAEDIVADAFVKAYISLPGDIPTFQFWLFRVCKNLWIDHLRKHSRTTSADAQQPAASEVTPESVVLAGERSKALWQAIDDLAPQDRELVVLHYFSGLSLQEVSRILNKSYPAVRQRLHRLRLALKKKLEEQGYDNI